MVMKWDENQIWARGSGGIQNFNTAKVMPEPKDHDSTKLQPIIAFIKVFKHRGQLVFS